jgi:large subunit ribosomal protein L13
MSKGRLTSYLAKPGEVEQKWHHVDATDQILGRMAVRIATLLMGKHRPQYTPNTDTGDFVVVTNAEKVRVTGRKADTMEYMSYSYHPGGSRIVPYRTMLKQHPERVITTAVRRMVPKNALGRRMMKKLKVYAGGEHPHAAQNPQPLTIGSN